MGETNYSTIKRAEMLKRLTGEDQIPFEFKGKNPFTDINYAKIIIATNSLPVTSDKTIGFYRRWLIIKFPNQFSEGRDILEDIPEEEYSNLARKCVSILKELLERRTFTNEGDIEEKKRRYEELSNPVTLFIQQHCKKKFGGDIPFSDFYDELMIFLKEGGYREMTMKEVGSILNREGFEKKNKSAVKEDGTKTTVKVILGIAWKKETSDLYSAVMQLVKKHRTGRNEDIFKEFEKHGNLKIQNVIDKLKKVGLIFEPSPGRWQLV
jgi:phage/plasmid-associated DNA primase